MDKTSKFVLPSPNFNKLTQDAFKAKPYYLTPSGMSLLPREKQPPPMYGKHGATLPARYLHSHVVKDEDMVFAPEKQYCETCEQELHSLEDLKRHRAQHENCPVDGCLFKGHPSVMDKHVIATHNSGLFDKFKKLSTPEEIAAWREERRKRYPTVANVLLKQKAREQKQKRGERLESNNNRFGKANDRKRAQANTQDNKNHAFEKRQKDDRPNYGNKKSRKNKNKKSKKQEFKSKVQNDLKQKHDMLDEGTESSYSGIKMFRGTSQLKNYNHFNEKKTGTANVLFALVGMYGSDDESDENEDNIEEINKVSVTENNENNKDDISLETGTAVGKSNSDNIEADVLKEDSKDFYFKSHVQNPTIINAPENVNSTINEPTENGTCNQKTNSSDEAPEEIPIQRNMPNNPFKSDSKPKLTPVEEKETKHNKSLEQIPLSKQKIFKNRRFGLDYRKIRLRKQNTMLEKLLESDIRHERNVLLQCVRYVCENNFFNIGQNKNQEPTEKNNL